MSSTPSSEDVYARTLAVFDQRDDPSEPLTTPEVADSLDCVRRTAYKRLEELVERGELRTKKTGARSRVWWRPTQIITTNPGARDIEPLHPLVDELLDRTNVGVFVLDAEFNVAWINETTERFFGIDRSNVIGRDKRQIVRESIADAVTDPDTFAEIVLATYKDNTYTEEFECQVIPDEGREGRWLQHRSKPIESGRYAGGRLEVYSDITKQKERQRTLHEQTERYRRLVEASPAPIIIYTADGTLAYANEAATDRIAADAPGEVVGKSALEFIHPDDRPEAIGRVRQVIKERETAPPKETTLIDMNGQLKHAIITTAPIKYEGEPAAQAVINDITDRKKRGQQLQQQQARLTALNNLDTVVRNINDAVIEQSTRDDIERIVCESLADSDSYEFAWIAEVDPKTQSVHPRVEAGVDGYLEEIPLSADPSDPVGRGPAGRAIRTQEIQVIQDTLTDEDFEPWHGYADKYGYRSSAAVPITYEGTLYGVLGVYADRANAFTEEEQEVIGHLGESIGHAIAALKRKQALMSDEAIELSFCIPDIFDAVGISPPTDGVITIDRALSLGDDVYLTYGTATEDALPVLEALVEQLPYWVDQTILSKQQGDIRFEARLSDPPMVSLLAAQGGHIKQATIEHGECHMTIHLPPSVDTQRISKGIKDAFPTVELITRQQVTKPTKANEHLGQVVHEELTDRQRVILEAAYHSGFFESPRTSSGEDVAESLEISASTFHQHLRKAERRILSSMFAET